MKSKIKFSDFKALTPIPSPRGRGGWILRQRVRAVLNLVVGILVLFGIWCLGFGNSAWAAGEAGQDLPVLEVGIGARPLGMGSAFSALADDANIAGWNPAGLSKLKASQLITMQGDLFLGTKFYSLTYAQPLGDKGGISFSWLRLSPPGQERINTSGTIEGVFSAQDEALILSYGRSFSPWSLGASLKYISRGLYTAAASGLRVDLGFFYQPIDYLSFSLVGKDLSGTLIKWSTNAEDTVIPKVILGLVWKPVSTLAIAGDLSKKFSQGHSYLVQLGAEWWLKDILALRIGSDEGILTTGTSLKISHLQIDYAYINHAELGGSNRISLSINP